MPARVLRISGLAADVDVGDGLARRASLAAPEAVRKGDYVMLYADLVVSRIDRRSAFETLKTMREMAAHAAEEDGRSVKEASQPFDDRLRGLSGKVRPRVLKTRHS